jgi:indolepyruvate ferredoxin oxidoreductase
VTGVQHPGVDAQGSPEGPGDGPGAVDQRTRAPELLTGVEALVRLLAVRHEVDARDGLTTATMVSGYPGSPLGTLDLGLERAAPLLDAHRVVHRPGLNEELAMATVWGSQMGAVVDYDGVDGVVGAWYGKTPGLDRSGDALKHANAMGAGPNGGVVLLCGDDPTAKSSTLTCDSQHSFEDACVPVLVPADQQDVIDLGVHAFRLSRYAGSWVGLKVVTTVADGIGTVDLDLERHAPTDPAGVIVAGRPWHHEPLARIGPHTVPDQEALVVEHRLRAAQAYVRHNGLDRTVGAGPGARLGIVCAGKTYLDVVQAFTDLGVTPDRLAEIGVRILKLAMTWPLVPETVTELAASVDQVLVIEEKRPFVETQLRSTLHEAGSTVPVVGKRDRDGEVLASSVGELDAASVAAVLTRVLPELTPPARPARTTLPMLELPPRPPGFCSGCPHNRSTIFPEGALVGGGVGCHGIMYFEARHAGMTAIPPTPMGAEGVPWIGLAPFVSEPHLIQNLGDGTLSHSGSLAIRACVAAGVNVTFKILYNQAVAMTGGQEVTGLMDVPSMTRALEAEGVRRIVVCAQDPARYGRRARWADGVEVLPRERLEEVQAELERVSGVTVIIYDQQCAAEARRLRKRGKQAEPPHRVIINEAVCEGCGDCSTKSNCLSVLPLDTEMGEKRQIHDLSCNRDYTCLEGDCPSFVTVTPARRSRRVVAAGGAAAARPSLPTGTLPDPVLPVVEGSYGVYFTGIGGTGVVTANRIIALAAESAGFVVGGMDQTGLSQKAGAVVSHLHLATDRAALGAATVSPGGAGLYLSGDLLQAAGPKHLERVDPGRTIAVVDDELTPTASMLQRDAAPPDAHELEQAIVERVGADRAVFVDSTRIAEHAFANPLLANVVLLGAAYQLGGLPFSIRDIETAMGEQNRGAADNLAAFAWGRWVVHDRAAVERALAAAGSGDGAARGADGSIFDPTPEATAAAVALVARRRVPDAVRELVVRRAAQVVDYQSTARARRFLDLVDRAVARDDEAHGWALTRTVVEAWFKLLTYKDEYEVARLHLKVDYDEVARDLGIEGPYRVKYHLHPPTLRRMGMDRKLPMGRPYEVMFSALAKMKRLRGTPLDIFGYDPDRRLERAVVDEYEALIDANLRRSREVPYDDLVDLAASAMSVKGYAGIKETSVAAWRERVAAWQRPRGAGARGMGPSAG